VHAALTGTRVPATATAGGTSWLVHTTALLQESKHRPSEKESCAAGVSTQYWNLRLADSSGTTPPKAPASRNLQRAGGTHHQMDSKGKVWDVT
jgi:hypothetical protein